MDPLSLTATVITLIAATSSACKGLKKLHQILCDEPQEISELIDEVISLKVQLNAIGSIIQHQQARQEIIPQELKTSLKVVLYRTEIKLTELNRVIEELTKRKFSAPFGSSAANTSASKSISNFAKMTYGPKGRSKIKIMQRDLEAIRIELANLWGTVNS